MEGWEKDSQTSRLDDGGAPIRTGLKMLSQTSEVTIGKHVVHGHERATGAS